MADDKLKLKIGLEVDNQVDTSKVKKNAENAGKEIGENMNKGMAGAIAKGAAIWDTLKGAIQKVWNMTKQFLADSISLANEYESAFAGVRKTVDGTAKDFVKLDNSLRKLSKEIPMTYKDLAGIMELGGQLGVKTKDLDKFTKAVAQLGTATNLTSENAAQMLAQFANITKMDLNDIDRLGSVIVDLGNNFATTESDIVNFAQRIAGAGEIAGISQPNIMAIATAFSSVGIEAEAGGTAVQKVLLDMNSAVTTGGDQLEKYAKIVGMTTDEFKKLYKEHPEQIFIEFVKSLQGAGQEAQLLLDELGLNDQRLVRGFLSLSQNADILTEAIDRSNTAWEENIALSNEAMQRYSTTESQIVMQQNERADMMSEIGEKLQGVVLVWETVKTKFVEAIGSFLGVTTEASEATEILQGKIQELTGKMDDLQKKFKEGGMSMEDYVREMIKLEEEQDKLKKAYDDEIKRRERLRENIETLTAVQEYYLKSYKEGIEKYGEGAKGLDELKRKYEETTQKIADMNFELENGYGLTKQEIEQKKEVKKYTEQLKEVQVALTKAKEDYNKLKTDDSATRAQLEASRLKVVALTNAYQALIKKMQEAGIGKRLGLTNDTRSKILDKMKSLRGGSGGGDTSGDDGGVVGEELFGGSGSGGGGGGKKKSKAEEMAESFKKEMNDLYKDMDSSVSEHQRKLDSAKDNIEKVQEKYEDLRNEAKETWREAQKALKEYNEELENAQMEAVTDLGQRYVELKKDLIGVDDYMKKIAEEMSWKDVQTYQDWGYSEYRGYDLKKLIDLKEKLDEIKLIEENTTEEQRKSEEFVKETSKTQEILNKLKEKEAELEEKKAVALERQAIATAQMYTYEGQQRIKVTQNADGTLSGMYEDREGVWQEIHDLDNLEYAKQLADQTETLGKELDQFTLEKKQEEEILEGLTIRKISLEKEYEKAFKESIAVQKKEINDLIARWERLIAKKNEYYGSSTSARAYGGDITNAKVTLVGENGPEQIIARQASYVQPRNASNSYSTVNNNNSSNLTINGMSNSYGSIDEMLDDLKGKLTYRD